MPISAPYDLSPQDTPQEAADPSGDSQLVSASDGGMQTELIHYEWTKVGFGIVTAGVAYAVLLACTWASIAFFSVFASRLSEAPRINLQELIPSVVGMAVFGLFIAAAAGVWTIIIVLVLLPLTYLIARTLRLRGSMVWLGAVAGGAVGFVATVPLTATVARSISHANVIWTSDIWNVLLVVVLGPGLATIVCQIGGAWGGYYSKSREAKHREATRRATYVSVGSEVALADSAMSATELGRLRFQFGIRHMLWAAVWFSLLFSVMRLSGFDLEIALPILLGWIGYQMLTLWLGARLWQAIQARRLSRRQRCT